MKLRITVKTPKNQASKCVHTQKTALLGHNHPIISSRVTAHNEYYHIIETKEPDKITEKCARAETMIKKFYSSLIKWLQRANALAQKFKRGTTWVRRYIRQRAASLYGRNGAAMIDDLTDDQIRDIIRIDDLAEMRHFLSQQIISVTEEK